MTNPPWSKLHEFLKHALRLAPHVVFLTTANVWWTKARLRTIRQARFGLRELILVNQPKEWQGTGFQLAAMHLEKGYEGALAITYVDSAVPIEPAPAPDIPRYLPLLDVIRNAKPHAITPANAEVMCHVPWCLALHDGSGACVVHKVVPEYRPRIQRQVNSAPDQEA